MPPPEVAAKATLPRPSLEIPGWGFSFLRAAVRVAMSSMSTPPIDINTDNITTKYINLDYRHKSICVVVGEMEGWELRKFAPDSDGDWTLRFHRDPISLEFLVDPCGYVSCVFRRGTAWIRSWDWEAAPAETLAEWIRAARTEAENHYG